ncbi:MAG TPA: hypothetical protein DEA75_18425 [Rhodobacteraceae bacterium]|nr:hypothetical protein [Paracoccaceae bacterium]
MKCVSHRSQRPTLCDDQVAIEGAKRLGNIKSIKNVIPKTGDNIWVDEPSTIKQKIQYIIKKKVSSGKW